MMTPREALAGRGCGICHSRFESDWPAALDPRVGWVCGACHERAVAVLLDVGAVRVLAAAGLVERAEAFLDYLADLSRHRGTDLLSIGGFG